MERETNSKTFFRNLKTTINCINKAVSDVTSAASNVPSECCIGEAHKDLEEKMDVLKHTQEAAIYLRKEIKDKNNYYRNYFNDIQDLVLEIEELVQKQENHLQKYGYEPVQKASVEELIKSPEMPESKIESRKSNKTPSFCALHINRTTNSQEEEKEKVKELVSNDGTPELKLDLVIRKPEYLEGHQSRLHKSITIDESLEQKEPSPVAPSLSSRFQSSVLTDQSVNDASYLDFEVARRLDF